MVRISTLLACLLLLAGCPSAAPDSSQFATAADGASSLADLSPGSDLGSAGSDAEAAGQDAAGVPDTAGPGEDSTSPDSTTPDSGGPDGVGLDSTGPDSGGPTGPCANNLGLFAKTADTGADESIFGLTLVPSGGAFLVGGTGSGSSSSDGVAVRVGSTGAVQWAKTLGNPGADQLRGAAASASELVAVGSTHFQDATDTDGWLVRLDSKGAKLGENHYGDAGNDVLYGLVAAGDGWLLAGSNRPASGYEDGWIVRTDINGAFQWEKSFGGSQQDEFHAVVALKGGTFAMVGSNSSAATLGSDVWVVVVDSAGQVLNQKLINKGEYDEGHCAAALAGGGFLLGGVVSNNGNPDLWVARADPEGNVFWQAIVTGNQSETAWGIAAWDDGSFVVAGESSSSNNGALGGIDGWLLRYDAFGNRIWDKKFGGTGNEWFKSVAALPDHGAWVGGQLWQNGGLDAWALRVDAWGYSSCASAGVCKNLGFAACDDGQPCTTDQCDAAAGCKHPALPDTSVCGDLAQCAGGQCIGE